MPGDSHTHEALKGDAGGVDRGHVWRCGVAEQGGVEALGDGEGDGGGGLGAVQMRAVIGPVSGGAGGVDEGEAELAGALEVGGADDDAALVVEEDRDLGGQGAGEEGEAAKRSEETGAEWFVHGSSGLGIGLTKLYFRDGVRCGILGVSVTPSATI